MSNKKQLNESLLIAKGNERLCYLDPADNTKVIKITYKSKNNRAQNILEDKYYKYLKVKNVSFNHIVDCYGWREIDDEKGLVFDRVFDYDKQTSLTLNEVIKEKILSINEVKKLLNELNDYLQANKIIFADSSFDNIMCQKIDKSTYKLVIIDGLGSRREGFKFWLSLHCSIYLNYRVKSQSKKIEKNLEISLTH